MSKVLGFDVSSTAIGYGLVETDKLELIKYGYINPIKEGSIIDRLIDTRIKIKDIIYTNKPDHIGIEDIICFMKGKSTANTIITLTAFNRMVCLASYDYLNKNPELFNVLSIRHGLKINKIVPKKEDMPDLVASHLGITFPYIKNKKNKNIIENYDTADGIAVALYYSYILTGKIVKKVKNGS